MSLSYFVEKSTIGIKTIKIIGIAVFIKSMVMLKLLPLYKTFVF
jgi:hypothetical protein